VENNFQPMTFYYGQGYMAQHYKNKCDWQNVAYYTCCSHGHSWL